VGNEENVYPVPDLNKTAINVTKELSDAYKKKKNTSKKKSLRNSWRKYKTCLTRCIQEISSHQK
jgi:hypothetical protein